MWAILISTFNSLQCNQISSSEFFSIFMIFIVHFPENSFNNFFLNYSYGINELRDLFISRIDQYQSVGWQWSHNFNLMLTLKIKQPQTGFNETHKIKKKINIIICALCVISTKHRMIHHKKLRDANFLRWEINNFIHKMLFFSFFVFLFVVFFSSFFTDR